MAITSPVAGFTTSSVRPSRAATQLPPMKFSFATGRPFAMDWIALQVIPSFHCTETVELVVRPEPRHDSPDSRPETRRLRAMPFTQPSTRRAFLRRAGLGAAGLAVGGPSLLAACSKSAAPLRQVRVVNGPLAIDDNTPHLFESATGVFLRYQEYTDPAAYLTGVSARLRAHRDVGADVVVVPDLQAARMIAAGGFVRCRRRRRPRRSCPRSRIHASIPAGASRCRGRRPLSDSRTTSDENPTTSRAHARCSIRASRGRWCSPPIPRPPSAS